VKRNADAKCGRQIPAVKRKELEMWVSDVIDGEYNGYMKLCENLRKGTREGTSFAMDALLFKFAVISGASFIKYFRIN